MQKRLGLDWEVPDDFGHWLAGVTDGEGHFRADLISNAQNRNKILCVQFEIKLRADDRPMLEHIKNVLGIGRIYTRKTRPPRNPAVSYTVFRIGDLYHILVPLFAKYPLRSKKATDFQTWKKVVDLRYHAKHNRRGQDPFPQSFWAEVESLVNELKDGRKFKPPPQSPVALS